MVIVSELVWPRPSLFEHARHSRHDIICVTVADDQQTDRAPIIRYPGGHRHVVLDV
jgi:hypothetical protein